MMNNIYRSDDTLKEDVLLPYSVTTAQTKLCACFCACVCMQVRASTSLFGVPVSEVLQLGECWSGWCVGLVSPDKQGQALKCMAA